MKTIQLDNHYQNVSGVHLAPGTHSVQDDLANYLANNGHAVLIESADMPVTEPLPQAVDSVPDYPSYTRAELMELLDDEGIAYSNRDNKDTLLALLTGDDN